MPFGQTQRAFLKYKSQVPAFNIVVSSLRYYRWGKLGKGYMGSLFFLEPMIL